MKTTSTEILNLEEEDFIFSLHQRRIYFSHSQWKKLLQNCILI